MYIDGTKIRILPFSPENYIWCWYFFISVFGKYVLKCKVPKINIYTYRLFYFQNSSNSMYLYEMQTNICENSFQSKKSRQIFFLS